MFLSAIFGGATLTTVVPLIDPILTRRPIILPSSIPSFLQVKLAGLVQFLNRLPPLTLLYSLLSVVLLLIIIKGVVNFVQVYLTSYFGKRAMADLRKKLFSQLTFTPLLTHYEERTGESLSRITYDVGLLDSSLCDSLPKIFFKSLEIIIYLSLIFTIQWKLASLSLILIPFFALPISKIGSKLRRLSLLSQKKMANLNSLLQEVLSNIPVVKSFNQEKREIENFSKENEGFFKIGLKMVKRSALLSPITEIVAAIGGMVIIGFGVKIFVLSEPPQMSAGIFLLFIAGLFSLISPVKGLGTSLANLQRGKAALFRIFKVFDRQIEEDKGSRTLKEIKEGINFSHLFFTINKREILKDINLNVRVGEKIGIVGVSGVGKTSLINLLLRFFQPTKGDIYLDGIKIEEFKLSSLRDKIGFIPQEPFLFNTTLRENIAYGKPEASDEEIMKASKSANIHRFIEGLPKRYDTVIGERGAKISGGERQRISIARAILKDPPILIFDEATSSLDSESERLVQEALEKVMEKRTVFIIAHRLSTLRKADSIIVLDKGKIVEVGTHQELIDKGGIYKYFYLLQTR